jgi:hypothetical protein
MTDGFPNVPGRRRLLAFGVGATKRVSTGNRRPTGYRSRPLRASRAGNHPGKDLSNPLYRCFNLLDDLSQTVRRIDRTAVLSQRGPRNCQSQLASLASQKKDRSIPDEGADPEQIEMNGLTFKASCDSSVAIAP